MFVAHSTDSIPKESTELISLTASDISSAVSPLSLRALQRSVTQYKGTSETSNYSAWFWEALTQFTSAECSLFLRFVWYMNGREQSDCARGKDSDGVKKRREGPGHEKGRQCQRG